MFAIVHKLFSVEYVINFFKSILHFNVCKGFHDSEQKMILNIRNVLIMPMVPIGSMVLIIAMVLSQWGFTTHPRSLFSGHRQVFNPVKGGYPPMVHST